MGDHAQPAIGGRHAWGEATFGHSRKRQPFVDFLDRAVVGLVVDQATELIVGRCRERVY
jgi:hypothetical protein